MKRGISLLLIWLVCSGQGPALPGPWQGPYGSTPSFTNVRAISSNDITKKATRTQGTGTSRRVMTFNFWWRSANVSSAASLLSAPSADAIGVVSGFGIILILNGGTDGICGSTTFSPSNNTYYQITIQIDTTKGTLANGCKIFVNGADDTSVLATVTTNYDTAWGSNGVAEDVINEQGGVLSLMDEFSKIDGSILPPTDFSVANVPIDISGLTFGSQGYWLRFETGSAVNVGLDSSGNGNSFTNANYVDGDFTTTVP